MLPDAVFEIVVRAVIDDDQLPILICLREDPGDCLVDQISLVVDRQHDADERRRATARRSRVWWHAEPAARPVALADRLFERAPAVGKLPLQFVLPSTPAD